MTDYRRFLGTHAAPELVLAYTGGRFVRTAERQLRLRTSPGPPGWYAFTLHGREARLVSPAETPALDGLPLLRGHRWGSRLVLPDASAPALAFLPPDEPLAFAPLLARRWHEGSLVVEGEDFETELEEEVRRAFEAGVGLGALREVPASLRAAFVYALCEAQGLPWQPLEIRTRIPALAEAGPQAVASELQGLERERARAMRQAEARIAAARAAAARPAEPDRSPETWAARRDASQARRRSATPLQGTRTEGRVRAALEAAGATFGSLRSLEGGRLLEVRYRFLGDGFESLVAADTLNVVDAGICLDGADGALTLESLPGVIREAVRGGVLFVTRRW